MDNLDLIKILIFCSMKDPMKRMRRQIIDWEKIVGHHISDKGLVLRIQKNSQILTGKEQVENGQKKTRTEIALKMMYRW